MTETPQRRWFQFRLSTWLVLVAILAWALMIGPTRVVLYDYVEPPPDGLEFDIAPEQLALGGDQNHLAVKELNTNLMLPALALVAFMAWKAAWRVAETWRRRKAS